MSVKDLTDDKAQDKLEQLVNTIEVAMMITDLSKRPLNAVPMYTKQVDKKGDIWFLSHISSEHNLDLKNGNDVQLLYNDTKNDQYISVYGKGAIVTNADMIHQLYDDNIDGKWFDGPTDPLLSAIRITPSEAYYWDNKTNKFVSFFKKSWAAITGTKADLGKKGHLEV
ncbi:pyridoxamine 5'-phosphate oxidase family protein [Sungkyunkwania multivorans]|uniref:Pyridoxamine 5'-phosphate oxidase family protein n=1 Tax=Sungkyunkwania multivorans TaxID=1173618 RepID=A0ABW3CTX2_9FLAO